MIESLIAFGSAIALESTSLQSSPNSPLENQSNLIVQSSESLRFPIKEFQLQGNTLLSTAELQAQLQIFLGENRTLADLIAAQETLRQAYQAAGYGLVSINLPQRLDLDGIFQIEVVEIRLAKITITGNQHFSNETIRAALPELQAGISPNLNILARQLFLANDNSDRQLILDFQSAAPGTSNVEIKVQDSNPQHWAIRLDNTGTELTGRTRLSLFGQNSNLWARGHLAAFSLTLSPEKFDKVRQFGLFYQAPIPEWGDEINFNASYSDINSGRIADIFNVTGRGYGTGLHLLHNLSRSALERHTLDLGLDYRLFQNNIDFFGINLGTDVAALPISLGYQYTGRWGEENFGFGVNYQRNIPGILGKNDEQTYNNSRLGATVNWSLVEANLSYQRQMAGWLLNFQIAGQYAGQPLISGEQLGLGGARTIRGLEEREVAGDDGIRASLEIYTPDLGAGDRLLVFTDFGRYWRQNPLPGEVSNDNIWTAGIGWRWNLPNQFNAGVDLGYAIDGATLTKSGDLRLHFNLQYQF